MHFFRFFAPILKITISETDSNLYLKNNGYGHPVRGNLKARKSSAFPGFQKYKLKINNSMYFSHRQKKSPLKSADFLKPSFAGHYFIFNSVFISSIFKILEIWVFSISLNLVNWILICRVISTLTSSAESVGLNSPVPAITFK
ncbi:hypothetical protein SAMN05444412_11730 [Rhodonellum ikkaensis]|uniref:Uncharacterized protein n=1 Tax=Rhodonellum ikkaensis TaxID=336829 RepID=A0A1H3TFG6_9BACT|nr:hypothetical protein SAMN05444412_11730 [Rhodonellum ikkaensis]